MADRKILIIDDDLELCEEIAEALRDEGYCVTNTSDSIAGESFIKKEVYDTVILDYKMSGLNGVDILRNIKTKNPKTKVYIITGRPFIEKILIEEKVSQMVDVVINKPFNVKALLEKIGK